MRITTFDDLDLDDKIVECCVGKTRDTIAIEDTRFELQNGRVFLVGHAPRTSPNDKSAGVRVCVAWDDVSWYIVHEDIGGYLMRRMSSS